MKKVFTLIAIAAVTATFVACGPSKEDLEKAEKAKQQLSAREKTPVVVDVAGKKARIDFSRDKFDEITSALLKSTLDKTDAAITVAQQRGFKVNELLLVGGSTRMPQVTRALEDKYGIKPKILEPDEAVAKGAAIHAVNVYINKQRSYFKWGEDNKGDVTSDSVSNPSNSVEQLSVDPKMMSNDGKTLSIVD